jgi:integrase
MSKRSWGSGSVFRRGSTWWIAYRVNGKLYRESAETDVKQKAQNLLKERLPALHTGNCDPDTRKTTVADLYELIHNDYKINGKRYLDDVERNWKNHLESFFGHFKAPQVNYAMIARYLEQRQDENAANATCNREIAHLKRMFHLGLRAGKISKLPVFPARLAENNIRVGFVEAEEHAKLATETAKFGLWLRAIFETGYTWGWRHEDVLGLRVKQVDLKARSVRLEVGTTKNKVGRLAVMTQPLFELLKLCCEGKQSDDWVFTRAGGKRVRDFRVAWQNACARAGLAIIVCPKCFASTFAGQVCKQCKAKESKYTGLIFHDLRRTAVRNMVRAGIPERVAMMISGHKTRSVFERYNIVSEKDLLDAAVKLQAFHEAAKQDCSQNVHTSPQKHPKGTDAQQHQSRPN